MTDFTWIDPNVIPEHAHLLHYSDVWCIVNAKGEVLVYQLGTGHKDANALIGNKNRVIVERLFSQYECYGATGCKLVSHVFLPDSPGRY